MRPVPSDWTPVSTERLLLRRDRYIVHVVIRYTNTRYPN